MFSAALLALKLAFGGIGKFCLAYWRIILPLLMLGYCLHLYFAQVSRADTAELALSVLKADIAEATKNREAENAVKKVQAAAKDKIDTAIAQAELNRLSLNRARETKNIKDQYEASNNSTKLNFTERLRLDAERYRLGLSESISNTSGSTEGERECNAAYLTLERACQITTVDFNRCRAWADNVCLTVGCE